MTSTTTIVLATTDQVGAGECVMHTQHVNHSTFRMLHMWTSGKFELTLQLHVFVACGVVNKFYGHQAIATDVF